MNKKRLRSFRKKENLEEKPAAARAITEKSNVLIVADLLLEAKPKQ